jgi:SAM-dependent methyltransferase
MFKRPEPAEAQPTRLNLGCGKKRFDDCLNVDYRSHLKPDLVWDLNKTPYPLPRSHFTHIFALDVIEHLADIETFMVEAHDLLTQGGVLEITTPHFSCANSFTDPTHKHHLGYFSFDYFTEQGALNFYNPRNRFQIVERILVFHPGRVRGLVARFANRHPKVYEQQLAWVIPAWFLKFQLRASK